MKVHRSGACPLWADNREDGANPSQPRYCIGYWPDKKTTCRDDGEGVRTGIDAVSQETCRDTIVRP